MPYQFTATKAVQTLSLIAVASLLAACGQSGPLTGRRIVDSLEQSRIAVPDDAGRLSNTSAPQTLPATGLITLADLIGVAESRSPDLAAARSSVGIAAGHAWQASLYPNPRIDLSSEDLSWRNGTSNAKTTVGITQPIVIGGRLQAAVNAAEAEQAARLAEVETHRRVLFGDIAVLYARLVAIRDQERLYAELRTLVDKTLSTAQTRFDAKAAPETDVIRPRVEIYRVDAALARLKHESSSAAKELGLYLGGGPIDPTRLDGSTSLTPNDLDSQHLESLVRTSHPALTTADREIDAAMARIERVKAEKTPDLEVHVGTGYNAEIDSGIVDLGVGMTVPLWDAREGDALSARFELMRARQERAGIENELLRRLANAVGEFESAKAQLDTFRDMIVPEAQRAFDQTTEGYRAGRSSFLDLLDAQRTLTEARVTLTELASAVTTAKAKVIQIVGPEGPLTQTETPAGSPAKAPSPIQERPSGAEVHP